MGKWTCKRRMDSTVLVIIENLELCNILSMILMFMIMLNLLGVYILNHSTLVLMYVKVQIMNHFYDKYV